MATFAKFALLTYLVSAAQAYIPDYFAQIGSNGTDVLNGHDYCIKSRQILATGSTTGSINGQTKNGGGKDVWIASYTYKLARSWTRQWPDVADSVGINVAWDQADCLSAYIAIETVENGTPSVQVRQVTSTGADGWSAKVGDSSIVAKGAGGIRVTNDGVYIALTAQDGPMTNAHLCQLNKQTGQTNWCAKIATSADDFVGTGSIAADQFGDVYVAGSTTGGFDSGKIGARDAFVAKVGYEGSIQWIKNYGGTGDDNGVAVAVDYDILYLVGNTKSSSINGVAKGGAGTDFFAMKLDRCNGSIYWTRIWGNNGTDLVKDCVASGGRLWMHGVSDWPGPPEKPSTCHSWGCQSCGSYSKCPEMYQTQLIWYNSKRRGAVDWWSQEIWDAQSNKPRPTWATIWGATPSPPGKPQTPNIMDSPAGSIRSDPLSYNLTMSGTTDGFYNAPGSMQNYGSSDGLIIAYGEYDPPKKPFVPAPVRVCEVKGRTYTTTHTVGVPQATTTSTTKTTRTTKTTKTTSTKSRATTTNKK